MLRSRIKWLIGAAVRRWYGDRELCVPGPGSAPFHFKPAEYARLVRGVEPTIAAQRALWAPLVRPDEVVWDVGANIGITLQLFFAMTNGRCRVAAFEPIASSFGFLKRNAAPFGERAKLVPAAVGDHEGTITFVENPEHPALSRMSDRVAKSGRSALYWQHTRETRVPLVTLDAFLDQNPDWTPTLIKLDVEGAGASVMQGARRLLERCKPALTVEFHWPDEQEGVTRALESHGYVGFARTADGRWRRARPTEIQSEGNFLHAADPRCAAHTVSSPGS